MSSDLVASAWDRHGERLVLFFREILAIPSLSGCEEAVARRVVQEMEGLGLEEARTDGWGNALARAPGDGPRIMLCSHIDV
ncbi:hypothetical protein, partial [Vibrio parahaemolyticus]|uniref:hypothetical protein n=1 Tax=Vibrio parahaemolyticus TaxID=670 RepID=UPI002112CED2